MQLIEVKGKGKKSGKAYTAYQIKIGKYRTPLLFPSEIEADYIKNYLRSSAHADFKAATDTEESLEDEDDSSDDEEI